MSGEYEKVIISRIDHQATATKTMVIQLKPTVHEHNVMTEVLKHIRREYPGAWYCVQQWERQQYPTKIGPNPQLPALLQPVEPAVEVSAVVSKIKAVTREQMGLPPEDEIQDVPL
jgi:hypothetical protein